MTDDEFHELEEVARLLDSPSGEILMKWLKRKTDFDKPVFSAEDNYSEGGARMRDGGRAIVTLLTNAPAQHKYYKEERSTNPKQTAKK